MEYHTAKSTETEIDTTMKYTLQQIDLQLDLLEAAVDKQHRDLLSKKEAFCRDDKLLPTALMIAANLQEIDNGKHLTRQDARFARLLVIAKHIDDMNYQR